MEKLIKKNPINRTRSLIAIIQNVCEEKNTLLSQHLNTFRTHLWYILLRVFHRKIKIKINDRGEKSILNWRILLADQKNHNLESNKKTIKTYVSSVVDTIIDSWVSSFISSTNIKLWSFSLGNVVVIVSLIGNWKWNFKTRSHTTNYNKK